MEKNASVGNLIAFLYKNYIFTGYKENISFEYSKTTLECSFIFSESL